MSKPEVIAEFERLITDGAHWLMLRDAQHTTVQALTDEGYQALCKVLREAHAATTMNLDLTLTELSDVLLTLGRKRHGHYYAALPLMHESADMMAAWLTKHYCSGILKDSRHVAIPEQPALRVVH
jgi:hypothetical protein